MHMIQLKCVFVEKILILKDILTYAQLIGFFNTNLAITVFAASVFHTNISQNWVSPVPHYNNFTTNVKLSWTDQWLHSITFPMQSLTHNLVIFVIRYTNACQIWSNPVSINIPYLFMKTQEQQCSSHVQEPLEAWPSSFPDSQDRSKLLSLAACSSVFLHFSLLWWKAYLQFK